MDVADISKSFAVVTCSDLQVVPERAFGLRPGELYVMQTPAHVVGAGERAGAHFARHQLGIELLVVLGHSPCDTIHRCASGRLHSMGCIGSQVHASIAACNQVAYRDAWNKIAQLHTRRVAAGLRRTLGRLDLSVVSAYFDEATETLEFL